MTSPKLEISADKTALAAHLADWLVARLSATKGPFAFNLSGGSTPKTLYALLATDAYRDKIDWSRVHIFFGDERFVPPDHPDSNYRMAREAMLAHVPIPAENVHAVPTTHGLAGGSGGQLCRYAEDLLRQRDARSGAPACSPLRCFGLGEGRAHRLTVPRHSGAAGA